MDKFVKEKNFYTTSELGRALGISKVSVLKRIWRGNIKAQKFGRNFIIFKKDIDLKKLSIDLQK